VAARAQATAGVVMAGFQSGLTLRELSYTPMQRWSLIDQSFNRERWRFRI
jgi:hypothetical protein